MIYPADIFNYALILEHLEGKFYREGLANFSQEQCATAGYDATFCADLKEVSSDETIHVSFLTTALTAAGATPIAECTYAFGITSVNMFVATATVLKGVGVAVYLGAAADILSKNYLTAAGSILTVEARHSSYLRAALKEFPFPQPFKHALNHRRSLHHGCGIYCVVPPQQPQAASQGLPHADSGPGYYFARQGRQRRHSLGSWQYPQAC